MKILFAVEELENIDTPELRGGSKKKKAEKARE